MTAHSESPVVEVTNGIKSMTTNGSSGPKKPYLLFGATPLMGHSLPLIRIAAELTLRGFDIAFFAGEEFKDGIEQSGARHIPLPPVMTLDLVIARESVPPGLARNAYDLEKVVLDKIPERWAAVKEELARLRREDPSREIIVVTEPFFVGAIPMVLGSALPEGFTTRPKVVNITPAYYIGESIDANPLGTGLLPDSTESGRARNKVIRDLMMTGTFAGTVARFSQVLKELGATDYVPAVPYHTLAHIFDLNLQLCPKSLEFDYSDLHPRTKFAGALLSEPLPEDFKYPSWWDDVTRGDKRIVAVSQGTLAMNYADLIIPTIQALADRDDLLVIVVLGRPGATLPEGVAIPPNTRIIDYLLYHAFLPHTSVFVMNAGYGGVLQGVTHGVPMVLGGETEDKQDVAARGEYAGVAVNLRTGRPTPAQVREGVERVLGDDKFKRRVMEIKRENEGMDVIGTVEKELIRLAAM